MKTNLTFPRRYVTGIAPLFVGAGLCAAPLTWFPGPSLDSPRSSAATTIASGGNNLLIGGDSSVVQELAATNSYWTYLLPFNGAALAPGAVASGGLITVYGGNDGTSSTSAVVGYSPSDNSVQLSSMSVARSNFGYAPDRNGYAYAIGGLGDSGQPLSSAERYNPDSDTWAAIAPLPGALYDFPAVFDRTNHIFIFGGKTSTAAGAETATVLSYSVSANNWTALASIPIAVAGSSATLGVDGNFYVVGGTSGGVTTNVVQVYNPGSNSWVISTLLPEGLSASAMGVDRLGRLIVMGGVDADGNDVSDVWRSQELGAPDTAPGFVSYPGLAATYQLPYVSSISATGNPQPTYVLLSGPSGMQVDAYSGAIAWTPQADQIGSNSVTVRAVNYAGFADWNFTITVPNPPPAVLTNLNVGGLTDNSVALSWDPESPVVGPVTYSVFLRHSIHDPKGSGSTVWYTQIGSTTTLPTITITGLTPGLSQTYYVSATAPGGSSAYAGISATTTAPQGPPNLRVTGLTSTTVSLAWDASPGPAQNLNYSPITSYTIMERNVSVSPATNIPTVSNITDTSGSVAGLTPGRSHIWFVSGVDAAGNASTIGAVYFVVTNPVPVSPSLSGVAPSTSGGFQLTVAEHGSILQTVLIQATTKPADSNSWVQIGSLLPTSNPFTFTDTSAAQYPMRFYRLVAP